MHKSVATSLMNDFDYIGPRVDTTHVANSVKKPLEESTFNPPATDTCLTEQEIWNLNDNTWDCPSPEEMRMMGP